MARYKDYCYAQDKLIAVSFGKQILPGMFEYTLSHLIDHELELSAFDERYRNDETGAPAYDPRVLLKVVLLAYPRGLFSSDPRQRTCICPASKHLYRNGSNVTVGDLVGVKFTGPKSACLPSPLRAQCLRTPDTTPVRQVVFFKGRAAGAPRRPSPRRCSARSIPCWARSYTAGAWRPPSRRLPISGTPRGSAASPSGGGAR